jgi:hypothetical protein
MQAKGAMAFLSTATGLYHFVLNAGNAFALNLAVFLLIGRTSALTMNVGGASDLDGRGRWHGGGRSMETGGGGGRSGAGRRGAFLFLTDRQTVSAVSNTRPN